MSITPSFFLFSRLFEISQQFELAPGSHVVEVFLNIVFTLIGLYGLAWFLLGVAYVLRRSK